MKEEKEREAISNEIRRSLKELRDILTRDDISLTVLVLPIFKPYEDWEPNELESRYEILQILDGLHIRHFDLLEVLNTAIAQGVNIQEKPGDTWHPSKEICILFANYLFLKKLL